MDGKYIHPALEPGTFLYLNRQRSRYNIFIQKHRFSFEDIHVFSFENIHVFSFENIHVFSFTDMFIFLLELICFFISLVSLIFNIPGSWLFAVLHGLKIIFQLNRCNLS